MTASPRVLLVTPRYPPALGGVERHVAELATRIAARGFTVEVATTLVRSERQLARVALEGSVVVRRFPTIRGDAAFALSPRLALWLLRSAGRFDLIHGHSYHTPVALLAAVAAVVHGVPFVLTLHYHGTGHTAARRLLHRPYRWAGRWMVRRATVVICNSVAEEQLVRRDFGTVVPSEVILPGIDLRPARSSEAADGRTAAATTGAILTGGRLEPYKQVDLVVRALEHLPAQRRLVVFGEGPDAERLKWIAADAGVAGRVTFAGRLPDDELAEQLRLAAVFASMSRKEAFGLTVLESAAAGAPVVASDIPAYREVAALLPAGTVRFVHVDADAARLAAAIEEAATGPRPVPPDRASLPTWASMASGVASVYQRVLRDDSGWAAASWRSQPVERIHVTGGSGSGKSSLARVLGNGLGAPVHHLDEIARERGHRITSEGERTEAVRRIAGTPRWVTEGIQTGWTDPLCERADVIVWLDHVSTRTRLLRVLRRFVAGGVAESRRQRGVRRFFRPASYARHLRELARATGEIRAYGSAAPGPATDAGSRSATAAQLARYAHKVVHCRSRQQIDDLIAAIDRAATAEPRPPGANE